MKQAAEIKDPDGKVIAKNIKVITGNLFDQMFLPLKWRNPFTEDTVNRKDIFKIPVERKEIIEPEKIPVRGTKEETIKQIKEDLIKENINFTENTSDEELYKLFSKLIDDSNFTDKNGV